MWQNLTQFGDGVRLAQNLSSEREQLNKNDFNYIYYFELENFKENKWKFIQDVQAELSLVGAAPSELAHPPGLEPWRLHAVTRALCGMS